MLNKELVAVVDRASLSALCLVSRQTLAPSRRTLYRQAFKTCYGPDLMTKEQALALLMALEANGNALGQLVRDTNGLVIMCSLLYSVREYINQGQSPREYYVAVLKACTKLRTVDISFSTESDILDLFKALELTPSLPSCTTSRRASSTIRNLLFWGDTHDLSKPAVDFTTIFETLSRSPITSLDEISFSNVQWKHAIDFDSITPTFPLPVKSLQLWYATTSGGTIFPFFPRQASTIQRVSIAGGILDLDLAALSRIVGTDLRNLDIAFRGQQGPILLSTYATRSETPRLPPTAFETYPSLTSLDLCETHGPSLILLETLVKSSPLLVNILFTKSRWVCSYNPLSTFPNEIFPEDDIIAILKEFLHLKHIHFGYLPTVDPLRYEGMTGELAAWGIKVEYQICTRV